jgi:hypothetical protein
MPYTHRDIMAHIRSHLHGNTAHGSTSWLAVLKCAVEVEAPLTTHAAGAMLQNAPVLWVGFCVANNRRVGKHDGPSICARHAIQWLQRVLDDLHMQQRVSRGHSNVKACLRCLMSCYMGR